MFSSRPLRLGGSTRFREDKENRGPPPHASHHQHHRVVDDDSDEDGPILYRDDMEDEGKYPDKTKT